MKIEELKDNDDIKGVLVYVDSPGGSLSASSELMMAIKELRASKPVVAYGAGSLTSGSYYAVIHANKIIANPGAFVGSIGVLMQSFEVEELAKKIGVKEQTISAGAYKQMGTFTRPWSENEKDALQKLADESYDMFVTDIQNARGLKKKEEFADAKVFLASSALKVGLIDAVGSYSNAQKELVVLSGVEDPIWQKQNQWERAFEKFSSQIISQTISALVGLKAY